MKRRRWRKFFHAGGASSRLVIALEEAEAITVPSPTKTLVAGGVVGEGVVSRFCVEWAVLDDILSETFVLYEEKVTLVTQRFGKYCLLCTLDRLP